MLRSLDGTFLSAKDLVALVTVKLSVARVGSEMPEIKFSKLVTILMGRVK